jgi:hypothetical protein
VSIAVLRGMLLPAALALFPAPALADVTARYALGKEVATIEVDDGGDWRLDVPGQFTLIRRGGVDYIALKQGAEMMVFKLDELVAAIKPEARAPGDTGSDPFTNGKFTLTRGADVTIGGYKGVNWSFGPEAPQPKGHRAEIATSKDPALASIGAVFVALHRRVRELGVGRFGAESNFLALAGELVASGTPIRVTSLAELRSVDEAAIDPKRFELPGPVISADVMKSKVAADSQPVEVTLEPQPKP